MAGAITAGAITAGAITAGATTCLGTAWPLRMLLSTSSTTPRMSSSVICIWPPMESLLMCREDRLVVDVDGVHDADDSCIDRKLLRFRRHAGTGTLDDQHHLALAGADRVHAHERAARADQLI